MRDYHINIFYSEDDEGYIADIPDLDACSAFGLTPGDALQEVQKAKALWLQAARAEKNRFLLQSTGRLSIKPHAPEKGSDAQHLINH
jgi:predicted RNase H-like HicB family nuclease